MTQAPHRPRHPSPPGHPLFSSHTVPEEPPSLPTAAAGPSQDASGTGLHLDELQHTFEIGPFPSTLSEKEVGRFMSQWRVGFGARLALCGLSCHTPRFRSCLLLPHRCSALPQVTSIAAQGAGFFYVAFVSPRDYVDCTRSRGVSAPSVHQSWLHLPEQPLQLQTTCSSLVCLTSLLLTCLQFLKTFENLQAKPVSGKWSKWMSGRQKKALCHGATFTMTWIALQILNSCSKA